jgi:hypothetical protein
MRAALHGGLQANLQEAVRQRAVRGQANGSGRVHGGLLEGGELRCEIARGVKRQETVRAEGYEIE